MSRAQRQKKFVDSQVQGALARRIIFQWVVFFIVASVSALVLQVLSNPFRPASDQIRELWWTQGPFLLVVVFLLPVFVLDAIKLSHRFAGPIFSLRRAMREAADGKLPRKLKFREGDFWQELAQDYNDMIARFTGNADCAAAEHEDDKSTVGSNH